MIYAPLRRHERIRLEKAEERGSVRQAFSLHVCQAMVSGLDHACGADDANIVRLMHLSCPCLPASVQALRLLS